MKRGTGPDIPCSSEGTVVVNGVPIGGRHDLVIMAGPCAVECREQVEQTAAFLARMNIPIMRGGAFKPRTSPFSFQGLGEKGLKILKDLAESYSLRIVTEVMDTAQFRVAAPYTDIIQVGARSMYNTSLLRALGEGDQPVLLKRGFSSTIDEFLSAVDHIAQGGNRKILLCERGIRTFEHATRFTLDISAVPVLKGRTDLPVIVDPSHAAGDSALVPDLAMAAVAAGADALLIEIHPEPAKALCDSKQALTFEQFEALLPRLYRIRTVVQEGQVHEIPRVRESKPTARNQIL